MSALQAYWRGTLGHMYRRSCMGYRDTMLELVLGLALVVETPIGLRVEVQPLGRGRAATVVGLALQVAPEDRVRVGERAILTLTVRDGSRVVDQAESAVTLEQDGSALLYREWPVGELAVRVGVASLDGSAKGGWTGNVKVPSMEAPFTAMAAASPDAVALAPAVGREGAVEFLPPPRLSGVGAVQLEVRVPVTTARVVFFQDDRELVARQRPPWTVSVPLGQVARRTSVRAEAYDGAGALLGEDALVFNAPGKELAVEILTGRGSATADGQRVTVAVSSAVAVDEIVLRADDRVIARWSDCPCVVTVPTETWRSIKVLSADAVGRGGLRGEAVKVLGVEGFQAEVRVEVVELPVTVVDADGKLVTGLGQEDFRVQEDEQEVQLESFAATGSMSLSLGLAVDVSGSMKEEFSTVRRAVALFAERLLRGGDNLFLMTFSWEPTVVMPWRGQGGQLAEALEGVRPEGGTSLHDAVVRGLEQFHGRRGRTALVLLTDGDDTTSRTAWDAAIRFAKTVRTPVFPIGFKIGLLDFVVRDRLRNLAELTGGEYFPAPAAGGLDAVYDRIGEQLRAQYLLVYRSPSVRSSEHFRTVKVTLGKPGLFARTIAGYYPTQ